MNQRLTFPSAVSAWVPVAQDPAAKAAQALVIAAQALVIAAQPRAAKACPASSPAAG
jgi:hypothetical protein